MASVMWHCGVREAVQRYLSGSDAEYHAACLPAHVLQQYGEIRHESKNAAVSYGT